MSEPAETMERPLMVCILVQTMIINDPSSRSSEVVCDMDIEKCDRL